MDKLFNLLSKKKIIIINVIKKIEDSNTKNLIKFSFWILFNLLSIILKVINLVNNIKNMINNI